MKPIRTDAMLCRMDLLEGLCVRASTSMGCDGCEDKPRCEREKKSIRALILRNGNGKKPDLIRVVNHEHDLYGEGK